ncbi:4-hydroxy-tetrahydrodipicolinate synthase [Faunimonas pinastri]|uniref:4-hydroxy-tetrahydrodipicolinate synthase n=1 Tax=Faunimonas pinastri TaxID=1855383 RepID=A0A1H9E767_9HYPH|nr:dihydrodipicolinate synthase family protein [Faunimonas pinastri]SEQ21594.1 4-hydroxy-tetrahydrodipicolinate synthase [Faunimonas pinastri]
MLLDSSARGVYVISATPFTDTGELDLASLEALTDFYLERGATGLTVLGMMGEAPKLSPEESAAVLETVLARVAGRVPVVVGVSNPGMSALVSLSQSAMASGAAGVMIAPLASLKTEEQVINYFAAVCSALGPDVPVVLQDFPLSTGVYISVATIEAIAAKCPQIVMLKHEDWPGLSKLSRLRAGETGRGTRRLSVLVGNGGLFLPQELARGADGAMTGYAYPEMLAEVCRLFDAGERERAEDLFDVHLPLIRHETQPGLGLAIRKEVLKRRGAIASAHVRAPGPKLDGIDQAELTGLMNRLEKRLQQLG